MSARLRGGQLTLLMTEGRIATSGQDAFERILASLYGAMLDDVHWPATTALIDEACGLTSNALLVGEGHSQLEPVAGSVGQ